MRKLLFIILVSLIVSGCAGGARYINALSAQSRDSIFIKSVEVDMTGLKPTQDASELEIRKQISEELILVMKERYSSYPSGKDAAKIVIKPSRLNTALIDSTTVIIRESDQVMLANYSVSAMVRRSGFFKIVQGKNSKITQITSLFTDQFNYYFVS